jgi:hypothetical protein
LKNWDVSLKGQSVLYNDLEIRLLIDVDEAKADYKKAAPWLKKLLVMLMGLTFTFINILK